MKLLLVDLETTGLEGKIYPIELAAGIYDSEIKMLTKVCSTLLPLDQSEYSSLGHSRECEIHEITGIHPYNCLNFSNWQAFIVALKSMSRESDYAVAHNAKYDRQFFDDERLPELDLQWLDSQDIPFKRKQKTYESLIELCSKYKIPIVNPHRALNDVLLLSELLKNATEDELLYATLPRFLVVANLPIQQKQLAKDAGFMWNRDIQNKWSKWMTDQEIKKLTFPHSKIEACTYQDKHVVY